MATDVRLYCALNENILDMARGRAVWRDGGIGNAENYGPEIRRHRVIEFKGQTSKQKVDDKKNEGQAVDRYRERRGCGVSCWFG
jgi:hypothetical protein